MEEFQIIKSEQADPAQLKIVLDQFESSTETITPIGRAFVRENSGHRKNILIGLSIAGSLALSNFEEVFSADKIDFYQSSSSIENLIQFDRQINEPYNDYLSEIKQLISPKSNFTKNQIFEKILSFKSLVNSWDGYDAIPTDIKCASNALILVSLLSDKDIELLDEISPTPNGTITMSWVNKSNETLSVEIGNNTMSYFLELNSQKPQFFNEIDINSEEANRISNFIRSL